MLHAVRASTLVVVFLASSLALGQDAPPPKPAEIRTLEKEGKVEDALAGWAELCVMAQTDAGATTALAAYVELASENVAPGGEPWLRKAVRDAGAVLVPGREVILAVRPDQAPAAGRRRLAALADASALVLERMSGVRSAPNPQPMTAEGGPIPPLVDGTDRVVLVSWGLKIDPETARTDGALFPYGSEAKDEGLAASVVFALASRVLPGVKNRRAVHLNAGLRQILTNLVVDRLGSAPASKIVEERRKEAKEAYETGWADACRPRERLLDGQIRSHLLEAAFRAEGDVLGTLKRVLELPREPEQGGQLCSSADVVVEFLSAVLTKKGLRVLQEAGWVPVGEELRDVLLRVRTEPERRDALSLAADGAVGSARSKLGSLAGGLGDTVLGDQLLLDALGLQAGEDSKKARSALKTFSMLDDFEALGPLPRRQWEDGPPSSSHLLALAVAHGVHGRDMKLTKPLKVSRKWETMKPNRGMLLPRTPWADPRGRIWGGSYCVRTVLKQDLAGFMRVRPVYTDRGAPLVLANGRPSDPWPDGSYVVPATKGTVLSMTRRGMIQLAMPYRGGDTVAAELRAVAAAPDAVLALRPWAARGILVALPVVAAVIEKSDDSGLLRALNLLQPYAGGNGVTFDRVMARVGGNDVARLRYLRLCRGNRDLIVLDRVVTVATAEGMDSKTLEVAGQILSAALFRPVPETGEALTELWKKGRKWIAVTGFAEAELGRDPGQQQPQFRVAIDGDAWGGLCLTGRGRGGGAALVPVTGKVKSGRKVLTIRWAPAPNALELTGAVTTGKKTYPFDVKASAVAGGGWRIDRFDLPASLKGQVFLVLDRPCVGYRLDAFAVGPAPLP